MLLVVDHDVSAQKDAVTDAGSELLKLLKVAPNIYRPIAWRISMSTMAVLEMYLSRRRNSMVRSRSARISSWGISFVSQSMLDMYVAERTSMFPNCLDMISPLRWLVDVTRELTHALSP